MSARGDQVREVLGARRRQAAHVAVHLPVFVRALAVRPEYPPIRAAAMYGRLCFSVDVPLLAVGAGQVDSPPVYRLLDGGGRTEVNGAFAELWLETAADEDGWWLLTSALVDAIQVRAPISSEGTPT